MGQPSAADAAAKLSQGLAEIHGVLRNEGFEPTKTGGGKGSGGYFATAEFAKGNRHFRLWLRGESLTVRYEIAGRELEHATYMRELLGPGGGNRFPSYSEDVRAACSALRYDLENYCGDFLNGSGDDYLRCWSTAQQDAQRSGLRRLARTEGELRDD